MFLQIPIKQEPNKPFLWLCHQLVILAWFFEPKQVARLVAVFVEKDPGMVGRVQPEVHKQQQEDRLVGQSTQEGNQAHHTQADKLQADTQQEGKEQVRKQEDRLDFVGIQGSEGPH